MSAGDLGRVMEIADGLASAPCWSHAAYADAMDAEHRPRRIALVAGDAGDELLGFLVAAVVEPEAELETIAVAQCQQGCGVGKRLFEGLLRELRLEGVTALVLEVRASNEAALRFYRAHGFEETGRRPRYYADPEEDGLRMRLGIG